MADDELDDVPDFLDRKKNPVPPTQPKLPQPKEVPVRTQTAKTEKLPVPPPKGAMIEKPLSKKALRVVAEKAVKENNVTKLPTKGSKEARAVARAKVEKPAPKADKPKIAKPGIGALAKQAILDGCTNEEALAKVKKAFPQGNTVLHNISWYRMDLRRKGILADTPAGERAAKLAAKSKARSVKKSPKAPLMPALRRSKPFKDASDF
jgi:hypothetical protein